MNVVTHACDLLSPFGGGFVMQNGLTTYLYFEPMGKGLGGVLHIMQVMTFHGHLDFASSPPQTGRQ